VIDEQAIREFLVPDLGEGLEDATVVTWHIAVGDEIGLNEPLCTVETNKADVEIPSPYTGRIVELGGVEGETLAVGSLLVGVATNGPVERSPVLVGYGADDTMDVTRRRARAKPPVRKLAAELNIELASVAPGSGPDGIVTRDDVLAAAGERSQNWTSVGGVRLEMARRMALSRREVPDAHASMQVECSRLLRIRDLMRHAGVDTVTPFVLTLRLLTVALSHHPTLNSTWMDRGDGPRIHVHPGIHLGVAVAASRGLLVPVVTDAQRKTTRELGATVARLIHGARAGTLKPIEMQGSTFTVSNFGALGLEEGVPVINLPEAAILGMGSLKPRAVVVDGEVVARPTMTLTCAFDHRVADGAQVAAFLRELKDLVEAPELALLDL
jgi:2-oxoisovalerate dehydrogenase E2 component (dihydrolipoyl transacylase)